jgi:hypothetical protein
MRQLGQSRQHGCKWPLSAPEATFDASSVPPLNDFENARFRARPHIPRDADVISVLDYLSADPHYCAARDLLHCALDRSRSPDPQYITT